MQPLALSEWGGGLTLQYSSYQTPQGLQFRVSQGASSGSPDLNPWRSTNYGLSLEYYLNPSSLINLELFRINVESFIVNGNTSACGLPDIGQHFPPGDPEWKGVSGERLLGIVLGHVAAAGMRIENAHAVVIGEVP